MFVYVFVCVFVCERERVCVCVREIESLPTRESLREIDKAVREWEREEDERE